MSIQEAPTTQNKNDASTLSVKPQPLEVPPMDQYNRTLVANVHPQGWQNPIPQGRYNLVVIGAGTAGLVGAIGASGLGGKVALVERHLIGGDCLNWGCVPSKSILRSARVVGELRKAETLGVIVPSGVEVNFDAIMARMRAIRAEISHDDSVQRIQREGVQLFLGEARFTGPDSLEVFDGTQCQTLHFAKALIATGARARTLALPGLGQAGYLTNETLFQLTELPRRLAVIGGGPLAAEMAQAFVRFGAQVTLLIRGSRFLPREDRDSAAIVEAALARDGVQILFDTTPTAVHETADGKEILYEQKGARGRLAVDAILLSIGRTPNIEGLNLEAANVQMNEQGLVIDDTLRTTNPRIYASGDVSLPYQFTHMADAASRLMLQNALFPGPKKKLSKLVVPWCTYTDPEVAHVGLYAHEAEAQGIPFTTFVKSLTEVDRSRTDGETEGFVKILVKKGTDQILGATIVASDAGEMINMITLAMLEGHGLKTLTSVILPYPVQSEAIKKIADAYNRTRLTPWVKRLLGVWMAWARRPVL